MNWIVCCPCTSGSPLHMQDVHAALQKLYDTGRFSDASIDAEPAPGGVELQIATALNYFVGGVNVEGAVNPPSRAQLLTASKLELGAPFAANQMGQAIENMRERLVANSLHEAGIQYHLYPNPSTEEMSIEIEIEPGPRARFDGVQIKGKFLRSQESIVRDTRWRRGFGPIVLSGWREATENRVQTGTERVRQNFQRNDRLQATVTLERLEYHDRTNTVTPTLTIDNGPIIQVLTTGAKVSAGRLRQLIPIYEERTVDRSLLVEGTRNLTDYFQAKGYFDASVDFTEDSDQAGVQVINYTITRNDRHKLVRIEFTGNHFFNDAALRGAHGDAPGWIPAVPLWALFTAHARRRSRCHSRSLSLQRISRRGGRRLHHRRLRRREGRHRPALRYPGRKSVVGRKPGHRRRFPRKSGAARPKWWNRRPGRFSATRRWRPTGIPFWRITRTTATSA